MKKCLKFFISFKYKPIFFKAKCKGKKSNFDPFFLVHVFFFFQDLYFLLVWKKETSMFHLSEKYFALAPNTENLFIISSLLLKKNSCLFFLASSSREKVRKTQYIEQVILLVLFYHLQDVSNHFSWLSQFA